MKENCLTSRSETSGAVVKQEVGTIGVMSRVPLPAPQPAVGGIRRPKCFDLP
jgi:hypothetical protein